MILILDFGSQVTQLIAKCIRKLGVYCIIEPFDVCLDDFDGLEGIILSGGPSSVNEEGAPKIDIDDLLKVNVPVLGICYGLQLIVTCLGGSVSSGSKEFGKTEVNKVLDSRLLDGLYCDADDYVWMSHGDSVDRVPDDFDVNMKTINGKVAAVSCEFRNLYGVQFHPEVTHTKEGDDIIRNFVFGICNATKNWDMKCFISTKKQEINDYIGEGKILCAVSGGVDSSVVASLLNLCVKKEQLICLFVDNGLLRKGEALNVIDSLTGAGINVECVDASSRFIEGLKGIEEPEKKRKIIGGIFIEVFEEFLKNHADVEFLAQGTLYPDVIESRNVHSKNSSVIKSHHNVGGLPERMRLKLIEPLKELFKDEVRELGMELGLLQDIVYRHPFPGPGLAVRIPGAITEEKIRILQEADNIFISMLREYDLYDKIWQAFVVLLPVKTVGVKGDERVYEYCCVVRAVNSVDGMTANHYPFEHDFIAKVASNIVNNVHGIARVMYDYTDKPPATIEWE